MPCRAPLGLVAAASVMVLLLAPGASAAAPPVSGAIDYQTTIQLGIQSQGATVVAPFDVTAPGPGMGALNFIEIRSENNVWLNVTVYAHDDYSSFCATANQDKYLVEGKQVTYFMIAFAGPSVDTDPPANHTEAADMAARFASHPGAPKDQVYIVVIERRAVEPSTVNFTQDRFGTPGGGGFLPGDFAPAAAGALAAAAAVLVLSSPRTRR